jgi:hypothetical protein
MERPQVTDLFLDRRKGCARAHAVELPVAVLSDEHLDQPEAVRRRGQETDRFEFERLFSLVMQAETPEGRRTASPTCMGMLVGQA